MRKPLDKRQCHQMEKQQPEMCELLPRADSHIFPVEMKVPMYATIAFNIILNH